MSAYIVGKKTIDAIVTGLIEHKLIDPRDAVWAGILLNRENYRSVNYRYSESAMAPDYVYEPVVTAPVQLLKAIKCYRYQSCEHDGWEATEAMCLCEQLVDALEAASDWSEAEYEAAEWGLD